METLIFNLQKCLICNNDLVASDQSLNFYYNPDYIVFECSKCKFFCEEKKYSGFNEVGIYYFSIFIGGYDSIGSDSFLSSVAIENDHIECIFNKFIEFNQIYNYLFKGHKVKKYIEACNYLCSRSAKILSNSIFV